MRYFFLTFLILLLSNLAQIPLSLAQYQSVDSHALANLSFEKAMKLRKEGMLIEAERHIYDALHEFPGNKDYQFELSNIYAAYYDRLLKTKKRSQSKKMLMKVAQALETTVMIDPGFIAAQYNLAVVYKRLGEFEIAREKMRKVIQEAKEKDYPYIVFNAYLQLGAIYQEQGFFYEANDMYEEAKQLNYYSPEVQGAVEDLKREEKRFAELTSQRDALERTNSQTFFTPYSHAADQLNQGQYSGNLAQAIPFVGMLLADQFLNYVGSRDEL